MNELKIIFLLIIFVFLLCVCNNYEYFGKKRRARVNARKAKQADKRSESLSDSKKLTIELIEFKLSFFTTEPLKFISRLFIFKITSTLSRTANAQFKANKPDPPVIKIFFFI